MSDIETIATVPRIGAAWPEQGGVYAGVMRGENGQPDYHLIVPDARGYHAALAWGIEGAAEPGAQSSFDGLANTRALIESGNSHPAAAWIAGLELDGHSDFYLPSRRELRLCWVNVPELFEDGWYWTSTQFSRNLAFDQYFDEGSQNSLGKSYEGRVRAVRRFNIS